MKKVTKLFSKGNRKPDVADDPSTPSPVTNSPQPLSSPNSPSTQKIGLFRKMSRKGLTRDIDHLLGPRSDKRNNPRYFSEKYSVPDVHPDDSNPLVIIAEVASGSFGTVWKAKFRGRSVAGKPRTPFISLS